MPTPPELLNGNWGARWTMTLAVEQSVLPSLELAAMADVPARYQGVPPIRRVLDQIGGFVTMEHSPAADQVTYTIRIPYLLRGTWRTVHETIEYFTRHGAHIDGIFAVPDETPWRITTENGTPVSRTVENDPVTPAEQAIFDDLEELRAVVIAYEMQPFTPTYPVVPGVNRRRL